MYFMDIYFAWNAKYQPTAPSLVHSKKKIEKYLMKFSIASVTKLKQEKMA